MHPVFGRGIIRRSRKGFGQGLAGLLDSTDEASSEPFAAATVAYVISY
jgi:hypothetical protein